MLPHVLFIPSFYTRLLDKIDGHTSKTGKSLLMFTARNCIIYENRLVNGMTLSNQCGVYINVYIGVASMLISNEASDTHSFE